MAKINIFCRKRAEVDKWRKERRKKETYLKELAFSRRVEKAMLAKENFLSQTPSAVTLFCSDELFFFCHPTPRMTRYFTMESGMSSYYVIFSHFPIHTAFLTESRERVSLKLFYHAGQLSSKTFRSLLEPLFKLFGRKTFSLVDTVTRSLFRN